MPRDQASCTSLELGKPASRRSRTSLLAGSVSTTPRQKADHKPDSIGRSQLTATPARTEYGQFKTLATGGFAASQWSELKGRSALSHALHSLSGRWPLAAGRWPWRRAIAPHRFKEDRSRLVGRALSQGVELGRSPPAFKTASFKLRARRKGAPERLVLTLIARTQRQSDEQRRIIMSWTGTSSCWR